MAEIIAKTTAFLSKQLRQKKKQVLLKHCKGIPRMKKVSAKEIVQLLGMNDDLAKAVLQSIKT